ncbi:short chain dehydrogenase [Lysinibacillus sp. 2017]|uniref:SDR family NAD(P)-dependent oxidoreductase n=1 Tax=unclassified Lysinibacillus TaxID=2636778 RepID=UPI000D5295B1|nr:MULTISPECIES: glucose 1-dehydrogenase [unclassified Lysinibacillus]AWE06038.1 short chain dehydrogenase [Lysinibacillus sp. 2017]TGN34821.1 SDR family oxidoreductase [Lysinibacillus sp. S2017]
MRDFEGKVVLITGGATGIGRATAIKFAEQGAKVVVADVDARAEETVELIKQTGAEAAFIKTDVTKAKDTEAMVKFAVDTFGGLDVAFNNAGVLRTGFLTETAEEDFDLMIAVDLKGVWLSMKYELLHMKNNGGVIVNTASEAGLVGTPAASAYVAAKHGVIGLTKTAAGEYANMNIRINAIAPGAIATPMVMDLPEEERQVLIEPQPMNRFGQPEEVADSVLWLASHKSSFVTGTTLSIDGGATSNAQSFSLELSPKSI